MWVRINLQTKGNTNALSSIFLTLELQEKLEKAGNVNNDKLKSHDLKQKHEIKKSIMFLKNR